MTISEMHQMFRQYAQQMGMQNVRAILPSQIDLLLNNSISDAINQVIAQNIGTTSDRVITDNSKLNQVNALKSLYKVWKGPVTLPTAKTNYIASYNLPFDNFRYATEDEKPVKKDDAAEDENTVKKDDAAEDENTVKKGDAVFTSDSTGAGAPTPFDYFFIVDLSIDYINKTKGNFVTNIFPIRIVDDQYLADAINDFVLAPSLRSPIASIHNDIIELYIDKPDDNKANANNEDKTDSFTFMNGLTVHEIRLSYIGKPAKVRFAEDLAGADVDCDLPESMHVDIVKHAVDLYRTALNGGLAAAQAQQQQQQRENVRNNARDDGNSQQ